MRREHLVGHRRHSQRCRPDPVAGREVLEGLRRDRDEVARAVLGRFDVGARDEQPASARRRRARRSAPPRSARRASSNKPMCVSKNTSGPLARPIRGRRSARTLLGTISGNQDVAEVGLELSPQVAGNVAPRRDGGEAVEVVEGMRVAGSVELAEYGFATARPRRRAACRARGSDAVLHPREP